MASFSHNHDVGARIVGFNALASVTIDSGSTDGLQLNGRIYDRFPISGTGNDLFLSAKAIMDYSATIATGESWALALQYQSSTSTASTAFTDLTQIDGSTSNTVTATTATLVGVVEANLDLSQANRYVRIQITPTHSTAATIDQVIIGGVLVFGGGDEDPAT